MGKRNRYQYHSGAFPLQDGDYVFVFDSNQAGLPDKDGNSGIAKTFYNAPFGIGEGIASPNSYAIPFKDRFMRLLSLRDIASNVESFAQYTLSRPELKFWIPAMSLSRKDYKISQIAPLFRKCGSNCVFPDTWRPFLK